jgi:hypothetical protein
MNASEHGEDPRLLTVAAAICRGEPVDWEAVRQQPLAEEDTTTLAELEALENLSRFNSPASMWGPFDLEREIGRGSFGTVYAAVDRNLQLSVALKVIRPFVPTVIIDANRAFREARLLAQINHPNVVRVFRAERVGSEVGVAMELVKGITLSELIKEQGPLGTSETMLIGRDLCRALAAVHAAGMVHGDLKARNVMREDGGRTVLMDFGACRLSQGNGPRMADKISGTPLYLAPELFSGSVPTVASDIYSLGVLLFHLVTGAYPVQGKSFADIERQHGAPRKTLREFRPDLSRSFTDLVDRATADRPEARFATAGAFEEAIEGYLASSTNTALTAGAWKRWAAAAAVVAAIGVPSIAMWQRSAAPAQPAIGAERSPATASTAVPPPATNGIYRVDAALQRVENGVGTRLSDGARVGTGDQLSLQVRVSTPAYVYVVNEDEQGESYLLFPLPGQRVQNPLPAGINHQLPGIVDGAEALWRVTSAGGRDHFIIFVSPEPPPASFERLFASLPHPTVNGPATSHQLSAAGIGALRGVGGLTTTPIRADQELRETPEFSTKLSPTEEVARGLWVRQISLENPR